MKLRCIPPDIWWSVTGWLAVGTAGWWCGGAEYVLCVGGIWNKYTVYIYSTYYSCERTHHNHDAYSKALDQLQQVSDIMHVSRLWPWRLQLHLMEFRSWWCNGHLNKKSSGITLQPFLKIKYLWRYSSMCTCGVAGWWEWITRLWGNWRLRGSITRRRGRHRWKHWWWRDRCSRVQWIAAGE